MGTWEKGIHFRRGSGKRWAKGGPCRKRRKGELQIKRQNAEDKCLDTKWKGQCKTIGGGGGKGPSCGVKSSSSGTFYLVTA